MICPRSAILHSAAASIVEGTFGLTVSIADRIATRTSGKAQRVREVDRVLHDVDLVLQRRRDVDRGVGDDQRLGVGRHVHDEAVADAPRRAQPGVALDHRAHQLVGVQAALHQRLGLALAHQRRRPSRPRPRCSGASTIWKRRRCRCRLLRDRLDARARPDQDRRDQAEPGRVDGAAQRALVAGMRDRGGRRRQRLQRSISRWYFSCARSMVFGSRSGCACWPACELALARPACGRRARAARSPATRLRRCARASRAARSVASRAARARRPAAAPPASAGARGRRVRCEQQRQRRDRLLGLVAHDDLLLAAHAAPLVAAASTAAVPVLCISSCLICSRDSGSGSPLRASRHATRANASV